LMNNLLGSTGLTVGYTPNKMYIGPGQAQCIIDLLPGGGTPARITGSNTCANHPGIQICNGRINNILLSQTIALGLNLRLSLNNLPGLTMDSPTLITASSSGCMGSNGSTHPVAGTFNDFAIPTNVYNLLTSLYGDTPTVADLMDLANKALGNFTTSPPILNSMLSPINDAVTMINESFDECNWGTFGGNAPQSRSITLNDDPAPIEDGEAMLDLSINPNPFVANSDIIFSVSKDSRVTLELYNYMGVKISTLYDYRVTANDLNTYKFTGNSSMSDGIYLLHMRTEYGTKVTRMIMTH
jgi:hypothetical protein